MKSKSTRLLTILAFAVCASAFLIPVSATAQHYGCSSYLPSNAYYGCYNELPFYCGPQDYSYEDYTHSPYSALVVPARPIPVNDYCCVQYWYPPRTTERSMTQNEAIPQDSLEEREWSRDQGPAFKVQPPDGSSGIRRPSIGRSGLGSHSSRSDAFEQFSQQDQEDQNQVSQELEEDPDLQGGWEFTDQSDDDPSDHDHSGHDHSKHDHSGHDHTGR